MKLTTLCYIEKDGKYLMLLRNKKKNDCNEGKWIGVGGKLFSFETPEECVKRETFEETGLKLKKAVFRGIVHFISDNWENENMYLYTSNSFSGQLKECREGTLSWVKKDEIMNLNLWEGDKLFLEKLLNDAKVRPFEMTLSYEGDKLVFSKTEDL